MGLGSYPQVSLKDARESAAAARKLIEAGQNPIDARKRSEAAQAPAEAVVPMFGPFAREMTRVWVKGFKNVKHRDQWFKTFGDDAGNVTDPYAARLEAVAIDQIDTYAVMSVIEPIWHLSVTAQRVRGRIERVLDAAKVKGYRSGENPARWEGHLELLLPAPQKLKRGHHKALPIEDVPAFMQRLRATKPQKLNGMAQGGEVRSVPDGPSMSALALEFLILTVARTGEVIHARRGEIDWDKEIWIVPKERMKEGREHRVPLTPRALEILRYVWPTSSRADDYIFKGRSKAGHLSNMALTMCLRGLEVNGATVHGMRSTFRDWVGDETDFPREVAEAALSHMVGDQAEQAYRRGDALKRRRKLMEAWENYLNGTSPEPLF